MIRAHCLFFGTALGFFLGVFLGAGPGAAEMLVSGVARTAAQDAGPSSGTTAVSDAGEQVEIISMAGTVEVKQADSAAYAPAEEGMMLSAGDTIKTGSGSSVELGFDESDRNIVRVEENTASVILLQDSEKIELLQGEVFSIIKDLPSGSAFEVRTPTAVAGARGTEWVTRYSGQETEVEAYDDVPFVRPIEKTGQTGSEVRVLTGQMTRVPRFGKPVSMGNIPQARQERWKNIRKDVGQKIQQARERRGRPERGPSSHREGKQGEKRDLGRKPDQGSVGGQERMGKGDRKKGVPEAARPQTGFERKDGDARQLKEKLAEKRALQPQEKSVQKADRVEPGQKPVQKPRALEGSGAKRATPGAARKALAPQRLKK